MPGVMAVKLPPTPEKTPRKTCTMVTKRTANHGFLRLMDGKSVNFTDRAALSSSSDWFDKYIYRCHLMGKVPLVQMKLARAVGANGSSHLQCYHLVYESLHNCS